jgi:predicted nucleotidyltransferase
VERTTICSRPGNGADRCSAMETSAPLLQRLSPVLAAVPGVVAVALGGSRARDDAHSFSDYDIGLYFSEEAGLDVGPA